MDQLRSNLSAQEINARAEIVKGPRLIGFYSLKTIKLRILVPVVLKLDWPPSLRLGRNGVSEQGFKITLDAI